MGRAFEYRRAAKEKRWANMSRIFPKLARAITVAAKEGGADPEMNPKLRTAIQNAKAQNMPKDNIESAIKRAEGKDAANFVEMNYEGKGPHGVLVFVECATDNTNRTVANVKSYFNKNGGSLVPSGSLEFMFSRKAVFELDRPASLDLDELELNLIDAGLEEIEDHGDTMTIIGDYKNFGELSKGIEDLGLEPKESSLQRFPTTPTEFTDEQIVEIEKLTDKLEDDDDVQGVFTNIG
ncbi:MAG TPA: YebC/PmpR family DNA-binding transcriptional regulator [Cytophagales bacterium]|nr:YebC/PmpR family DNA-binding transcriptional regulator [Cytophagales bacterium]HAA21471.1 YebC/PmpR family DNA-binding transcriptional regulator [Cytophagales bacterium]HAP65223.1 YebC/PmpR family DNA-binding transcriptional regulator [Cytophagales bacterium]